MTTLPGTPTAPLSRLTFVLAWLITIVLVPASRGAMRAWCSRRPSSGVWIPTDHARRWGRGVAGDARGARTTDRPWGFAPWRCLDRLPGRRAGRRRLATSSGRPLPLPRNSDPIAAPATRSLQCSPGERALGCGSSGICREGFSQVLVVPDLFGIAELGGYKPRIWRRSTRVQKKSQLCQMGILGTCKAVLRFRSGHG